jgi:hypothetical protein
MVEINHSAPEMQAETAKGFNASSIAGGVTAIYDNLPALVQDSLKEVEKYIAGTFGTPAIGDFHNVSDAASKGGPIALNGVSIDLSSDPKKMHSWQPDVPTVPDWPTTVPDGKIGSSILVP